ncbi:MAG: amidohydrolase [Ignavibacteria bacterium]|nr:amidohydrolase [Ignavibacteria bacterium]
MRRGKAIKIFLNGIIYTGAPDNRFCEAVVTANDRIIYTGTNYEARQVYGAGADIIDLQGTFMMPGFIDAHTHLAWGGEYLCGLDLSFVRSRSEFVLKTEEFIKENPDRWVTGGNWNQFNFQTIEMPHRRWLDPFSEFQPVLLYRMDYHLALANTAALERAGITESTPNPPGGEIERDAAGALTGILKDTAIELVTKVIPPATQADIRRYLLRSIQEANRFGVTSVHDISQAAHLRVLQELEAEGNLNCRVYARLPIEDYKCFTYSGIQAGFGSMFIRTGALKAFADGSLGAGTAYMFAPYADDPRNTGLAMDILTNGQLESITKECFTHNIQLSVHAIGDRANHEVLNIFERSAGHFPKTDRRMRIEHAQHITQADINRFAELGLIASMQPFHLFEDGCWMTERLGESRCNEAYPIGSLLRAGCIVCFGSDFPIVSINPLPAIYTAVTRNVKNNLFPGGFNPSEKISVKEAIRCFTSYAAFAAGEENSKGTIEIGKLADFVVLDRNLLSIPPDQIPETRVLMTIVGANPVWQA